MAAPTSTTAPASSNTCAKPPVDPAAHYRHARYEGLRTQINSAASNQLLDHYGSMTTKWFSDDPQRQALLEQLLVIRRTELVLADQKQAIERLTRSLRTI